MSILVVYVCIMLLDSWKLPCGTLQFHVDLGPMQLWEAFCPSCCFEKASSVVLGREVREGILWRSLLRWILWAGALLRCHPWCVNFYHLCFFTPSLRQNKASLSAWFGNATGPKPELQFCSSDALMLLRAYWLLDTVISPIVNKQGSEQSTFASTDFVATFVSKMFKGIQRFLRNSREFHSQSRELNFSKCWYMSWASQGAGGSSEEEQKELKKVETPECDGKLGLIRLDLSLEWQTSQWKSMEKPFYLWCWIVCFYQKFGFVHGNKWLTSRGQPVSFPQTTPLNIWSLSFPGSTEWWSQAFRLRGEKPPGRLSWRPWSARNWMPPTGIISSFLAALDHEGSWCFFKVNRCQQ